MSDLKEQAKKIIAKGKLLNDTELINMGLDMLDAIPDISSDPPVESLERVLTVSSAKPEVRQQVNKTSANITDQFRVENKAPIDVKYGKKVALLSGQRVNKFLDDGLEAADLKGQTPPAKPKTTHIVTGIYNLNTIRIQPIYNLNIIHIQSIYNLYATLILSIYNVHTT